MGVTELLIIFIITSWLVFFAVVGIGVQTQHEAGDVASGTEPAAPSNPMIAKKFLWACSGGAAVTALFYLASFTGLFEWILKLSPYGDV